jgi:hypothetical protein
VEEIAERGLEREEDPDILVAMETAAEPPDADVEFELVNAILGARRGVIGSGSSVI